VLSILIISLELFTFCTKILQCLLFLIFTNCIKLKTLKGVFFGLSLMSHGQSYIVIAFAEAVDPFPSQFHGGSDKCDAVFRRHFVDEKLNYSYVFKK